MKTLEIHQMEQIKGGFSWGSAICGVGFAGYAALIQYGLAAVAVTGGASLLVGFGIGVTAAVVCSFAE